MTAISVFMAVPERREISSAVKNGENSSITNVIIIDPILESYERLLGTLDKVTRGNTMARVRMTMLYARAHNDGLVVGTGDKSELLLGYFTKYGDGGVDLLPIGDLYKTWVRQLALRLGVPERIAKKPSSPRLWPGHLAEDELGITYEKADSILYAIVEKEMRPEELIAKGLASREEVARVLELMKRNTHKLIPPPVPKISRVTAYEYVAKTYGIKADSDRSQTY
jgi:NAD+ synthase